VTGLLAGIFYLARLGINAYRILHDPWSVLNPVFVLSSVNSHVPTPFFLSDKGIGKTAI
jgi:hypothetical protein